MLRTGCALLLVTLWSLPLSADEPAIELDTTALSIDDTVEQVLAIVNRALTAPR